MRNFVAGILWGSLAATTGLIVLSEFAPLPRPTTPAGEQTAAEVQTADATEPSALATPDPAAPKNSDSTNASASDTTAAVPENGAEPAQAPAPVPLEPASSETTPTVEPAATTSAGSKAVTDPETAAPETAAPETAAPETAAPETAAPESSAETTEPALVVEPAAPAMAAQTAQKPESPAVPTPEDAPVASMPPAEPKSASMADDTTAPAGEPAPEEAADTLLAESAPAGSKSTEGAEQAKPVIKEPDPASLAKETAPADPASAPTQTPETVAEPAPLAPAKPEVKLADAPTDPSTKTAMADENGVTVNRLPRIGDAPAATATDAAPAAPADKSGLPALQAFAADFTSTTGNPPFAILLLDLGDPAIDRAAYAALPIPVTFVIDPMQPGSAEIAKAYRAAGREVVMLASGLPAGARPSDLEQSFQAHAQILPEAIAVLDAPFAGLAGDADLANALAERAASVGWGIITFDEGLNRMDQVARRAGLSTTQIYRDLDAEGESTPIIKRYLDRAAFKAAQEGKAMVMGRLRPETLAALMEWSLETRAGSVTIAPASAVFQAP